MISISTNLFDPISGINNSIIAAKSRSEHKSQGFGSSPSLNKNIEYLELVSGQKISSKMGKNQILRRKKVTIIKMLV